MKLCIMCLQVDEKLLYHIMPSIAMFSSKKSPIVKNKAKFVAFTLKYRILKVAKYKFWKFMEKF